MTIQLDDELASFVDEASKDGEGSRSEVINRAIRREKRRRAAVGEAAIYGK